MDVFSSGWKWIAIDPRHLIGARILQISIGIMLLFRVLTELKFSAYLWGPRGIGWGSTRIVLGQVMGGLFDSVFTTEMGTLAVLLVLATAALALILGYWTRMATFLALVAFFLIGQRLPELPDGGDNITQLVLTYMIFLLPPRAKPVQEGIWVWLHNIAVLAIILQLVIMYTTSGFAKMAGNFWQHGVAMYYISQVQWFSLPGVRELFKNSLVTTMATYIPMFYQIMFPVAIISRIKLPWLALGVLFHLSIAIFMGLITFSTVMIGLEIFLITDLEYDHLRKRVLYIMERIALLLYKRSALHFESASISGNNHQTRPQREELNNEHNKDHEASCSS